MLNFESVFFLFYSLIVHFLSDLSRLIVFL